MIDLMKLVRGQSRQTNCPLLGSLLLVAGLLVGGQLVQDLLVQGPLMGGLLVEGQLVEGPLVGDIMGGNENEPYRRELDGTRLVRGKLAGDTKRAWS